MSSPDATPFFVWQREFFESLLSREFFETDRTGHPAYDRWVLANEAIRHGGALPNPIPRAKHFALASALLDGLLLANLTGGRPDRLRLGSWEAYGDADFDTFRKSRLLGAESFADLMVELSYGAWHVMRGNQPKPLEVKGQADLVVEGPELERNIVAECKRLRSSAPNRIAAITKKANRQIKARDPDAWGVLVADLTVATGSATASEEIPDRVTKAIDEFRRTLSGSKNRSVGAAVLTWDWLEVVQSPGGVTETRFLRRWERVDHPGAHHKIPQSVELYEGYTGYTKSVWRP